MRSDNPTRRWLMHATVAVLFLPLIWGLLTARYFGLLAAFQRPGPLSPWVVGVAAGYLVAFLLLLRWGALRTALILILVAGYLQISVVADYSVPISPTTLHFGKGGEVLGIDVYCNDVFLGTTPFEITEAEFSKRVPQWDVPPAQSRVFTFSPFSNDRLDLAHARFALVPHDPFHEYQRFGHTGLAWGGWSEIVNRLPEARYWWRFEKQGAQAVATMENFGGGQAGETSWANPHISFPSNKPHWKLLFDDLRERDYVPTEEWLAHVVAWADVLWPAILESSRSDERLDVVRPRISLRKHELSDESSPEECRQVWDKILTQIDRQNLFAEPSMESEVLYELARRFPTWVVEAYRLLPLEFELMGFAQFGIGERRTFAPSSPGDARRRALERLIIALTPPELFERVQLQHALVRGDWHRQILESYLHSGAISAEQKAAVRHQLRGTTLDWKAIVREVPSPGGTEDPALDEAAFAELAELARDKIKLEELDTFVTTRRRGSPARREKLANWLLHFPLIDDHNRGRLLSMVETPSLRLPEVRDRISPQSYSLIVDQLARSPNPFADELLIDIWEAWLKANPNSIDSSRVHSILAIDTPDVRKWIEQKFSSGGQVWSSITRCAVAPLPHLNWLTPRLAESSTDADRVAATCMLAAIDTPDAWSIITRWSKTDAEWVRNVASEKLALHEAARAERELARKQLADLFRGRIQPDDLLPSGPRFVWIGAAYVPE